MYFVRKGVFQTIVTLKSIVIRLVCNTTPVVYLQVCGTPAPRRLYTDTGPRATAGDNISYIVS